MKLNYLDIHSHLDFPKYDKDREEVLLRMKEAGVGTISIGVDKQTSQNAVEIAEQNENVWACIGIHPDDSKEEFDQEFFEKLVKNPKVVAVGECGLDYFRLGENNPRINADEKETRINADFPHLDVQRLSEEKERQKKLFEEQIKFADRHNLPLMLHVRPSPESNDAHLDALEILESYILNHESGSKLRGNSHFFTSTKEIAERYIKLGFTISFTGLITYVRDFDEIIRSVHLEMMHIETDSPFVAPVPHRGKRNEPTYVVEVAKKVAEIRGMPEVELTKKLLENSAKFFNLELDPHTFY